MEESSQPPCPPRIGLTFNLKKNVVSQAPDNEAEYDDIETVLAIKKALEGAGLSVLLLEADEQMPALLAQHTVDIVFNIAEGTQGRGREAEVPAILNYYRIPFTGSDETTLCIALDKALTKRLLASYRIRTPKYFVVSKDYKKPLRCAKFPVIVKPNAEGSSKGISDVAIASGNDELNALLEENFKLYGQDMLIEEYIHGREFTVGILGNGSDMRVFPPMEIIYLDKQSRYNIYSFNVKKDYKRLIRYECPANISPEAEAEMMSMAKKIYNILQCRDFSRLDFRLSEDGKPYFIEINPLPGLAPGYSDFPMIAEFNGIGYDSLVRAVLESALKRYGFNYVFNRGKNNEFEFL
ncbi:MAG: D-alanine--D-alanine ligase family protein [Burkholderiales bacterium]